MASTTVDRTHYNTLVDDDGSGNTGSIWDKADVDGILDAVDLLFTKDIRLERSDSAGIQLVLARTSGIASEWYVYSPTGSTELRFYSSGNDHLVMQVDGYLMPRADNTGNIGHASKRWQGVRAVSITPGVLELENGWRVTDGEKLGLKPGLAIVNPAGDLMAAFSDDGVAVRGGRVRDVAELTYQRLTRDELAATDLHPEQRAPADDSPGPTR